HELSAEQRLALTREFSQALAKQYKVAVDFAIHTPHGHTDVRNRHAHILMTTRQVVAGTALGGEAGQTAGPVGGLGEKSALELENKKLVALGMPTSHEQLRDIRIGWEQRTNAHLARAGLDVRIDHRSHQECGLEIEPTQHVGVHATQMQRRGLDVSRVRLDEEAAKRNATLIREKPEQVLTLITNEKSVFDRRDIARALHRAVDWHGAGSGAGPDAGADAVGAEAFRVALARVMASPALVELQPAQRDERGREIEPARYSTREMVEIERAMAASADRMEEARGFAVAPRHVDAAISRQDGAIRRAGGDGLADEQRAAIEHITGPERIAAVVGLAGAGKSTMLAAAREAWQAQGYQVHGAALAGKAAEGLEESSGIVSRTLASWSRGWERGFDQLGSRDVFVIDEAGMVGSKQLSRFITEADRAGAKIVLIGDPEQLQPIGAGAAFRAVAERVGYIELEGIRRQREDWQRAASVDFGRHRTAEGLDAYDRRGGVRFEASGAEARAAIVRDVMADMAARPDCSRLVLAHRRVDTQALNEAIRAARQARGELGRGEAGGEIVYRTTEGLRAFAPGDRLMFRENSRDLGVKNGMLGTVERAEAGQLLVRLDSAAGPGSQGQGRTVLVSMADYVAVDHGYATTIHKSQGATVDRAFVLASGTMDRHLTYVAMTRHRDRVALYAGRDEFSDMGALSARLSRSQAKETTLDYERAGRTPGTERERGMGGFGTRRGIEDRDAIETPEVVPTSGKPEPVRAVSVPVSPVSPVLHPQPSRSAESLEDRDGRDNWQKSTAFPSPPSPSSAHQDGGGYWQRAIDSGRQIQSGTRVTASWARFEASVGESAEAHQARLQRPLSDGPAPLPSVGQEKDEPVAMQDRAAEWLATLSGGPTQKHQTPDRAENAIAPDSIESGRAGFRQRYEAHRQRQAAEAARDEIALDLVGQWNRLTDDYHKALPGLEAEPDLGGARGRLLQFAQTLRDNPEVVTVLRERGPAFGVEEGAPLEWVVAHPQPAHAIADMMGRAETETRWQLTLASEQEAVRKEQRKTVSRDHGMSL
ncbi:MAG TPA: Ti-type conjugative transfer relaxase TraA, partial [Acidiphilium sp.]|nr:Ti-type conjugative transfer relaxase TraA [Acidiphilium sp.]